MQLVLKLIVCSVELVFFAIIVFPIRILSAFFLLIRNYSSVKFEMGWTGSMYLPSIQVFTGSKK